MIIDLRKQSNFGGVFEVDDELLLFFFFGFYAIHNQCMFLISDIMQKQRYKKSANFFLPTFPFKMVDEKSKKIMRNGSFMVKYIVNCFDV
jgi:hypothetical protein